MQLIKFMQKIFIEKIILCTPNKNCIFAMQFLQFHIILLFSRYLCPVGLHMVLIPVNQLRNGHDLIPLLL